MSVPVSVAARFRVAGGDPMCAVCFYADAVDDEHALKVAEKCRQMLVEATEKVIQGSDAELQDFIKCAASDISRELGVECHGFMPALALSLHYHAGHPYCTGAV